MLAALPLALWMPYSLYRQSHLSHHRHEGRYLTDVDRDPESFYWSIATDAHRGPLMRTVSRFNCTLIGRLVLGPSLILWRLLTCESRKIFRCVGRRRALWIRHAIGVCLICGWLLFCHIPLWFYLACIVYPSISLTLLRSYAEHRADIDVRRRTRVVEAGSFWSLLFLNNNLHIAHHAFPDVAWYRLPGVWRSMREDVAASDLVVTGGYLEVMRHFLIRSVMRWSPVSNAS